MKTVQLRLDGELNIYRAAALKELLLAPLAADTLVELDLEQATDIDSAGLQLLMLAKHAALAGGGDLQLCASSSAVLELLKLLSLSNAFGAGPTALRSRQ